MLTPEEKEALICYARQQRRDPRDQAAIELQKILEQSGYLSQSKDCRQALALKGHTLEATL